MNDVERQGWNVLPPRRSMGFALTVDATARVYDLNVLDWGGTPYRKGEVGQELFLRFHNQTTSAVSLFFRTQSVDTADMNDATVISVGAALSLQATFCEELPPGAFAEVRIDRNEDKYLSVKTASSTATLRVSLASQQNA